MDIGKMLGQIVGAGEQALEVVNAAEGGVSKLVQVAGQKVLAVAVPDEKAGERLAYMHEALSQGDKAAVMVALYPELPAKALHLVLMTADLLTSELRKDGDISVSDFSRVAMRVAAEAV